MRFWTDGQGEKNHQLNNSALGIFIIKKIFTIFF